MEKTGREILARFVNELREVPAGDPLCPFCRKLSEWLKRTLAFLRAPQRVP
jgi:hypothetical protein